MGRQCQSVWGSYISQVSYFSIPLNRGNVFVPKGKVFVKTVSCMYLFVLTWFWGKVGFQWKIHKLALSVVRWTVCNKVCVLMGTPGHIWTAEQVYAVCLVFLSSLHVVAICCQRKPGCAGGGQQPSLISAAATRLLPDCVLEKEDACPIPLL